MRWGFTSRADQRLGAQSVHRLLVLRSEQSSEGGDPGGTFRQRGNEGQSAGTGHCATASAGGALATCAPTPVFAAKYLVWNELVLKCGPALT
jgi:hypothetical protein